ncbi:MAG TPA: hypothetical protein VIZ31_06145 [Vicinamibacteria bacterium]
MSRAPLRWLSASFCAASLLLGSKRPAAADEAKARVKPRPGRAILVVMDEVVDRMLPRLLEEPRDQARRVSVKGGLVGLGSWSPPGGEGYGVKAPPLYLFPRAGMGQSLNVDPITGRSYFGWP